LSDKNLHLDASFVDIYLMVTELCCFIQVIISQHTERSLPQRSVKTQQSSRFILRPTVVGISNSILCLELFFIVDFFL